jgi:hypothetical protein
MVMLDDDIQKDVQYNRYCLGLLDIDLAEELHRDGPAGCQEPRERSSLACHVHRGRYGNLPTQCRVSRLGHDLRRNGATPSARSRS